MILLELSSEALTGLFLLIIGIMIGPSIILGLIGLVLRKKKPATAKVLFILAAVYLLIAGGICGVLITG